MNFQEREEEIPEKRQEKERGEKKEREGEKERESFSNSQVFQSTAILKTIRFTKYLSSNYIRREWETSQRLTLSKIYKYADPSRLSHREFISLIEFPTTRLAVFSRCIFEMDVIRSRSCVKEIDTPTTFCVPVYVGVLGEIVDRAAAITDKIKGPPAPVMDP